MRSAGGGHYLAVVLFLSSVLTGCTPAHVVVADFARSQALAHREIPGRGFTHVVYSRRSTAQERWHVYIEGDGRPWLTSRQVAPDPTTPDPLMLRLMSQDPTPSVYLGRPCYLGRAGDSNCDPWFWTHGRYSTQVVESMVAALNLLIKDEEIRYVTLIGHSGGGALAVLMAPSIPSVDRIVTLAGNLDTVAWVERHGYTPLSGSLNPASISPLRETIHQIHFLGSGDKSIPRDAVEAFVERHPRARMTLVDDTNHFEGWEGRWQKMLSDAVKE